MLTSKQSFSNGSSGDDLKYKKAIKEISRLISINTSLKRQLLAVQQRCERLSTEHQVLQQKYASTQFQLNMHKEKQVNNEKQGKLTSRKSDLQNTGNISDFIDTKKKVQELQEVLAKKNRIIEELEDLLEQKQNQNVKINTKCYDLQKKLSSAKSNTSINCQENLRRENSLLTQKLKKSEEFTKQLSSQYEFLKKKILFSDTVFHKKTSTHNLYDLKQRKIEQQLEKQRKINKSMRKQLSNLRQDNKQKMEKIQKMNIFIEKQQNYIQNFVALS